MVHSVMKVFIIGFVLEGFLEAKDISLLRKTCITSGSAASLMVNCSGVFTGENRVPTVPSNLNNNLVILDISLNLFDFLNSSSFVNYTKMKRLLMRMVTRRQLKPNVSRFNTSRDIFKPLVDLEELDMTGTLFNATKLTLEWPSKLITLKVSSMGQQTFQGLTSLARLEEIDFSNNSLFHLPLLNTEAPIKKINLDDNPIQNLTVTQIAPFCELHEFGVRFHPRSPILTNPFMFCDCERLNRWIEMHDIVTAGKLRCSNRTVPPIVERKCNFNFDSDNQLFQNCMNKLPSTPIWELLLYAIFFSLLFPLLYFGFDAYHRYIEAGHGLPRIFGGGDSKSESSESKIGSSGEASDVEDHSDQNLYHDHEHEAEHESHNDSHLYEVDEYSKHGSEKKG